MQQLAHEKVLKTILSRLIVIGARFYLKNHAKYYLTDSITSDVSKEEEVYKGTIFLATSIKLLCFFNSSRST
jgi:hypothetical protein